MAVALNYASHLGDRPKPKKPELFFEAPSAVLDPGDVIYTGTPGETSPMKSGDVVEVEIEGIGVLKNLVA